MSKSTDSDIKVAFVAKEKAKRNFIKNPSPVNIKAFDQADTLFNKLTERKEKQAVLNGEVVEGMATRLIVLEYLLAEGWLVSRSGLYQHCKEGKLVANKDGIFEIKSVLKYAQTFLRRKQTGRKLSDHQDDLQERKLKAEVSRLTAQAAKAEHELKVAEGKYIRREDIDLELVGRAVVLNNGLSAWIQTNVAAWIELVGGDMSRVGDLIIDIQAGKDRVLNDFASKTEYNVEIEDQQ